MTFDFSVYESGYLSLIQGFDIDGNEVPIALYDKLYNSAHNNTSANASSDSLNFCDYKLSYLSDSDKVDDDVSASGAIDPSAE